jgi:3-methylcrotonyl-CoA carboxylase alpha subunit
MRIYAEDPAREFLPSTGTLLHLNQPRTEVGLRVDAGVRAGDTITPYYDPMIAKLIVHGADRMEAVQRLGAALEQFEVVGVQTNLQLLRAIAGHPAFAAADLDTSFIARHAGALLSSKETSFPDAEAATVWAAAALAVLGDQSAMLVAQADDPWSPWSVRDAWRLNGVGYQDIYFRQGEDIVALRVYPQKDGSHRIDLPTGSVLAEAQEDEETTHLRVDGVLRRVRVVRRGEELVVVLHGRNHVLHYSDPLLPPQTHVAGDERLIAPIPARVTRVLVSPGDIVHKGAPLLVLEAMKMEMTLTAPFAGAVESIGAEVDDMVEEGTELVTFAKVRSE